MTNIEELLKRASEIAGEGRACGDPECAVCLASDLAAALRDGMLR